MKMREFQSKFLELRKSPTFILLSLLGYVDIFLIIWCIKLSISDDYAAKSISGFIFAYHVSLRSAFIWVYALFFTFLYLLERYIIKIRNKNKKDEEIVVEKNKTSFIDSEKHKKLWLTGVIVFISFTILSLAYMIFVIIDSFILG